MFCCRVAIKQEIVAPVHAVLFHFTVSRWHGTGDTATQKVSFTTGKHFSMHSSASHLTALDLHKKEEKDSYNNIKFTTAKVHHRQLKEEYPLPLKRTRGKEKVPASLPTLRVSHTSKRSFPSIPNPIFISSLLSGKTQICTSFPLCVY